MQCPHLEDKKKVTMVTNTRHKERWRVGMCVCVCVGGMGHARWEGRDDGGKEWRINNADFKPTPSVHEERHTSK